MQTRPSKILDGYHLAIIYPGDKEYETVRPLFNVYGLAITDTRSNVVFVDGNAFDEQDLDNTHIEAIDAHEMAHIILGHGTQDPSPNEEMEADYFAILMLNAINLGDAAGLLIDNFQDRHGILYEQVEEKISPDVFDKIRSFMGKHFPGKDVINEIDKITKEFFDLIKEEKLQKSKQRLVENRVDDSKAIAEKSEMDLETFLLLVDASTKLGGNHKFLNWMVRAAIANNLSDPEKIRIDLVEPLQYFMTHVGEYATKDINAFATLEDFILYTNDVKKRERRAFKELNPGELIYEDEEKQIFIPETIDSSCYYGSGTKWCTTMQERGFYKEYKRDGELYYVLSKTKPSDDKLNKLAVRFLYVKGNTGYKIQEIRDTLNDRVVPFEEFMEHTGEAGWNAILADFTERRKDVLAGYSYVNLKNEYEENPEAVLEKLSYNDLTDFLRATGIMTPGETVLEILFNHNINPLTKRGLPNKLYLDYLLRSLPPDEAKVRFIDDSLMYRKELNELADIFQSEFILPADIVFYFKTKYSEVLWVPPFLFTVFEMYERDKNERNVKGMLHYYTSRDYLDLSEMWQEIKGIKGLIKWIHTVNHSYFDKIFRSVSNEYPYLRLILRSALKNGSTIIDVYEMFEEYKDETRVNAFMVVNPSEWYVGFVNIYGKEEGVAKLIPFVKEHNEEDVFNYLTIDALNEYYGSLDDTITAAFEFFKTDEDKGSLIAFLSDEVPFPEQLRYFKIHKAPEGAEESDDGLLELLQVYGEDIFDHYDLETIEAATGNDLEFLAKVFDAADLTDTFEEKAGALKMCSSYISHISDKDLSNEEKLNYRKKAFAAAGPMHDVRLNENGSVDLICSGWKDFEDWFYDGDVGRGGGNPRYVAKSLLADDDSWEPFYDVVQDWTNEVWDNTTDENIQKIREVIIESLIPNDITIDLNEIDLDPDDFEGIIDEDSDSFKLTPETLAQIDNSDLGTIIKEHDAFSDLKNNMKWAYQQSYNDAARSEWYESYTDDILGVMSGDAPKWEKTGKMITHRYKSDNLPKEYTSEEQVFVIPNISFFDLIDRWIDDNKEWHDEFEYSSFIDTVENLLSEAGDLLKPDPSEWPDHKNVEKYYNEYVMERIHDEF